MTTKQAEPVGEDTGEQRAERHASRATIATTITAGTVSFSARAKNWVEPPSSKPA